MSGTITRGARTLGRGAWLGDIMRREGGNGVRNGVSGQIGSDAVRKNGI
jgi:hypothetical protein